MAGGGSELQLAGLEGRMWLGAGEEGSGKTCPHPQSLAQSPAHRSCSGTVRKTNS